MQTTEIKDPVEEMLPADPEPTGEAATPAEDDSFIKHFMREGQAVPYGGAWFTVVKIKGPYAMLKISALTAKTVRRLGLDKKKA